MIDLKTAGLPHEIKICGGLFQIHTDFRFFLRLQDILSNDDKNIKKFDFMYCGKIPPNRLEGIRALIEFMNPPHLLPRKTGEDSGERVIDFNEDADLIYSAFMDQYKINLTTARLHWFEFMALLGGLHDTELNNVISYRLYKSDGRNDNYSKRMEKLREAWRLPDPADNAPDEALEEFTKKLRG